MDLLQSGSHDLILSMQGMLAKQTEIIEKQNKIIREQLMNQRQTVEYHKETLQLLREAIAERATSQDELMTGLANLDKRITVDDKKAD